MENEYPLLISGIVKKIENKLKKLGLTAKESPADFVFRTQGKKHRYSSICQTTKGKKLMFYAILHKSLSEKRRMRTECRLANYFTKYPLNYLPKYYTAKIENIAWITRELLPDLPVETLGKIETLKKELNRTDCKKIAAAIYKLNNLPVENFPFLKKFKIKAFYKVVESINKEKHFSEKIINQFNEFTKENKKLLMKENRYFTHGDFQIGNLIIFNNKVKIIDLESAHINNFAFDIAFFTTRLWQHSQERTEIIKEYLALLPKEKKEIFKILFRLDVIFIAFHTHKSTPREYSATQIKKRRAFQEKLLVAASRDFADLTNVS